MYIYYIYSIYITYIYICIICIAYTENINLVPDPNKIQVRGIVSVAYVCLVFNRSRMTAFLEFGVNMLSKSSSCCL